MYAASSNSSTASSTASSTSGTTSDHRGAAPSIGHNNYGTQKTSVPSRQRSHKSTRRDSTTGSHSAPTLQSLVRTKCWSIAPLWKFVTYELETQPQVFQCILFDLLFCTFVSVLFVCLLAYLFGTWKIFGISVLQFGVLHICAYSEKNNNNQVNSECWVDVIGIPSFLSSGVY